MHVIEVLTLCHKKNYFFLRDPKKKKVRNS